jgi:hypothetical protein
MRPCALICLFASLGLVAQEPPGGNRMGIGLALLAPQGSWDSWFGNGFQAGLQIHFNRESRNLGRLRIDYLQADSRRAIPTGVWQIWDGSAYVPTPQFARSRMEAYSVAYEWMPHLASPGVKGPFAMLGMGGTLWNETRRPAPGSAGVTDTESDLGFTLSAGFGWRFGPHATLEARYVNSDLSTTHGGHRYGSSRAFLTFGSSLRF